MIKVTRTVTTILLSIVIVVIKCAIEDDDKIIFILMIKLTIGIFTNRNIYNTRKEICNNKS